MITIKNEFVEPEPFNIEELAEFFRKAEERAMNVDYQQLDEVLQRTGVDKRKPTTNDYKRNSRFLRSNKKVKK